MVNMIKKTWNASNGSNKTKLRWLGLNHLIHSFYILEEQHSFFQIVTGLLFCAEILLRVRGIPFGPKNEIVIFRLCLGVYEGGGF